MDPDLLKAAHTGNPDLLLQIVHSQVELLPDVLVDNLGVLTGVTDDGDTVLHIAVRENHLELAQVVCSVYNALVLRQNRNGDTPLHNAARTGSVEMILLLVASLQKPVSEDFNGTRGVARYAMLLTNIYRNTALHEAVLEGHDDAAVMLLMLEPELSSHVNFAIQSPLYLAAEKKLMSITRALLLCPFASMDAPGGRSVLFNILRLGVDDEEGGHPTLARTASFLSPPKDDPSSPTIDPNLLAAARLGYTRTLLDLLGDEGPQILRGVTARKSTALHIAAAHGRLNFARLACVADKFLIAVRNARGDTPLHCAARAGHLDIVQLIIDISRSFANPPDAPPEAAPPNPPVPLEAPSEASDTPPNPPPPPVAPDAPPDVRDLHMYAVLRAKNEDGDTALHDAARKGDTPVASTLVRKFPALSSFVNAAGVSPLYLAIDRGSLNIAGSLIWSIPMGAEALLDRTKRIYLPEVSHAGPYGQTTLHVAVGRSIEICALLLEVKPDLAISVDCHGSTPLHYVAASGNIKIARLLLQASISAAYVQDENGFAPIHIAARMGHINIIKELIIHCPDCGDLVDCEGRTFLHLSIMKKRADVVEYTIRTPGLEHLLNMRDSGGNTPLHAAAMCDSEKIVQLLANDERIEKNSMNDQGCTPLDLALQTLKSIAGLRLYRITELMHSAGLRVSPYGNSNAVESYRNERDEVQSQRALVNNLALVAVLIATVSFAAVFTLPGGYNSNPGPEQGVAVLARKIVFKVFLIADTMAMVSSITVACILIYTALQTPDAQPHLLQDAINIFWIALIGMVVAFGTGAYTVVESHSRWLGALTIAMACSVPFVVWQLTSWGPHDALLQLWKIFLVLGRSCKDLKICKIW